MSEDSIVTKDNRFKDFWLLDSLSKEPIPLRAFRERGGYIPSSTVFKSKCFSLIQLRLIEITHDDQVHLTDTGIKVAEYWSKVGEELWELDIKHKKERADAWNKSVNRVYDIVNTRASDKGEKK